LIFFVFGNHIGNSGYLTAHIVYLIVHTMFVICCKDTNSCCNDVHQCLYCCTVILIH
jgi:hypothetical protein